MNSDLDFKDNSLNQSFQGFHQQNWSEAIYQQNKAGNDYVIATVLGTSGSTPRANGSKMVITTADIYDTLGGGHLEFKVIEKARQLLSQGQTGQFIEPFNLGANLGQCCGGATTIMFEVMRSQHLCLDIYGAGHVAQALINVLAQLPIHIRWIDSRAEVFPSYVPANVEKIVDEEPVAQVSQARSSSAYLILTHNHQLDFALTEAILKRDDSLWLGVIGSVTKAKRFRHRLQHREFCSQQIEHMTCPVGLSNVSGKLPMEVAVSIAGQLIDLYQNREQKGEHKNQQKKQKAVKRNQQGLQWAELSGCLSVNANLAASTNQQQRQAQPEVKSL